MTLSLSALNTLSTTEAENWFSQCCASEFWFKAMATGRPFTSVDAVKSHAVDIWNTCSTSDFLQAFEAHPMIGDVNSLRAKYAATKNMASNEQQGASEADEAVLQSLATANKAYLDKNGFIFIICASGLSAQTMLDALTLRLENDTATEVTLAAAEQIKITLLRISKGLEEGTVE
ncbi:2-oxo-4-hydroxy-4-carboxy-5-ureidoimidazoline decarboxylase [Paraglaciecola sp. 2405UD69-4]|uniref:2-oxo-4-hydroxy-4-carboxy-5-ureidoimidazoline decarboxylase n=1 Tax=Paraglaciecola sp. 2405UD69-4 TaxID=3391836 RepID=UPI0039C95835